ncbi:MULTISPECIES: hypothetical protein [unclassified Haladaptatus]|uniref:hypothetical protein n=1 Tax=unclassified Haladaptatus TaxID=2622732 RepID=UPI0023E78D8E|nr:MULTISPECIES: hypothetical protein [unclassified Haladaptatus]
MSCSHPLDAEFLYPSDAEVLAIEQRDDSDALVVTLALPCPECGHDLRVETQVSSVEETVMEARMEDPQDTYD